MDKEQMMKDLLAQREEDAVDAGKATRLILLALGAIMVGIVAGTCVYIWSMS